MWWQQPKDDFWALFYDSYSQLEGGSKGSFMSWNEVGRLSAIAYIYIYIYIYIYMVLPTIPPTPHEKLIHIYKVNPLISDLFKILTGYEETVFQRVKKYLTLQIKNMS